MMPIYETIHECRICSSSKLHEIMDLGHQPPANSIYPPEAEEPPAIPLRLVFCHECSTTQIGESVDPQYLFSQYVWVTGTSSTAVDYSHQFARGALARCGMKTPFVVEIASNDGTFLKRFQEKDCRVLGIDPAENLAQEATNSGVSTTARFFNQELAAELLEEQGTANLVIARNVIPHVKEIHSVIKGISILLDLNGTGIFEFHDNRLIQEELQYDYIYHEHLFYYSLASIGKLLSWHGLEIFDVTRSPISGGSWVVYFSKSRKEKSIAFKNAEKEESQTGVNSLENWLRFRKNAELHKEQLREILSSSKKMILAYGASARSSTLLNYCRINHKHVLAIIDKNPLKHGMISPGSKIPIISYEEATPQLNNHDRILLLAWNFREEILDDLRKSGYKGKFIIPLPGDTRIQ